MQYDSNHALLSTAIPALGEPRRGKVRDVYDLGRSLLFVATDRISAFDCIMPNGIPGKGAILTQVSLNWFKLLTGIKNHLITANVNDYPAILQPYACDLAGRSMIVRKLDMLPVECIVRGYLTGSGWEQVNYPHIATSSTYGHWVCVVGISPTADPENLRESDFYALDPARVSVNGTLAVTKLLDGTIWTDNSPLKVAA